MSHSELPLTYVSTFLHAMGELVGHEVSCAAAIVLCGQIIWADAVRGRTLTWQLLV